MNKKLIALILAITAAISPCVMRAQVNVQKTSGTNAITGNLVIGDGKTLTATGTGVITATGGAASLIATQVGYGSAGGLLSGEAAFAYTAASNVLTVDSVAANTSTDLTLLAGSSGAVLTLGQGANGRVSIMAGAGLTFLNTYADPTADGFNLFGGLGAGNLALSPGGGASSLASRVTAWGFDAGHALTTGYQNDLFGAFAGSSLTVGYNNSLFGNISGASATTAHDNSGFGNNSLGALTTGYTNSAIGEGAFRFITSGFDNAGIGHGCGYSVATGSKNVMLGADTGVGSPVDLVNSVALGYGVVPSTSNIVVIGNADHTTVYLGAESASANLVAKRGTFTGPPGGTNPALVLNASSAANGTAQYWATFNTPDGSTPLANTLRGNGAAGYLANGLNFDLFGGFQLRLNQLAASGEAAVISGGNLLVGGSTDIPATGGAKIFGTTSATSTTTGAFQIGGGTAATGIGMGGGAIYTGSGYFNVANAQINTATSTYGAGTAYSLTSTPAAIDFGTTDPVVTIPATGTYTISGSVNLLYNAATFAANQTVTLKFRRTNNTAADLANGTMAATTQIITTLTYTYGVFRLPDITYSATAGDIITIFADVSATPGAGSLDAVASGTWIRAKLEQ